MLTGLPDPNRSRPDERDDSRSGCLCRGYPRSGDRGYGRAQQIQEALLQGDQPIELEATAAGGDAGAGGGHPIVIFGLTGSEVTPGSGAETTGITTTTSDTTGGVLGAIPQPTGLSGVVTLTATESISEDVGTITYTATLSSPPEGPVTVTLSNGATITVADGATSGSVTVAAPGDDVYVGAGFVNVTITSATSDNFENLAFEPLALTKTIITDTSDTTTVTLNDVTVTEGAGTATIYASVSNLVTGSELLITLSDGATITIPVGASTGTSTPFAVQGDDPYVDGESYTVSISGATGGNFEALNTADTAKVTVNDDIDTTTAVLSVVEGPELGENGYSITYQVELQDAQGNPVVLQAGQEVTVSVNITDPNNEAADPMTFTITGGNSSDTEIYSHADVDPYIETERISAAIDAKSVSVNEGNLENLAANTEAVSVGLTDVPDTTTVTLTGTPSVEEGGIILIQRAVQPGSCGRCSCDCDLEQQPDHHDYFWCDRFCDSHGTFGWH